MSGIRAKTRTALRKHPGANPKVQIPPRPRPHMIDITKDIQPLTTFRNNSVKFMKRLKKTPGPIILTVNGKPEAVVQSAAEYQRLLDIAVSADVNEGIRQGLEDMREGRTRPADEVFEEMRRKYAMSR